MTERLAAKAVGMGAARLDIPRKIETRAAGQTRNKGRRVAQPSRVAQIIAELSEAAARRRREIEPADAVDACHVGPRRNGVGGCSQVEGITEILEAAADLELIVQIVDDLAVDLGGRRCPCRRDQTITEAIRNFRPVDAVELRRLMVEIGIADRYQVDAWCAIVKVG